MLPVSSDTLLRVGRRRARTDAGRLSVIGIDDWAFRRNHLYGTIACDLERRRIVALLPVPSGETCSTGNTNCVLSFTYQPYGVTLNFTPVVLSQGRIQLRVATEVTDIDNSKAITVSGTAVPAFRTRRNETTVELPSGGTIASAGLISTETQQAINGTPGLMNLPILGSLFRSRDYLHNETELLILVTPYIVHALDPREVVRPDANYSDATDPQSWLLGRVNRLYSTTGNSQTLQGYSGKVGFIND
jgi:pilus assembly protein CpaC